MPAAPPPRRVAIALCASLVAHGVLVVGLRLATSGQAEEVNDVAVVDMDLAPPPPGGFDPAAEDPALSAASERAAEAAAQAAEAAAAAAEAQAAEMEAERAAAAEAESDDTGGTVEPPGDPDETTAETGPADAGPADAGATAVAGGDRDAGPEDVARITGPADAGPARGDAGAAVASADTVGGAASQGAAGATPPGTSAPETGGLPRPAGSPVPAAGTLPPPTTLPHPSGTGRPRIGTQAPPLPGAASSDKVPPGADADLRPYTPPGDSIAVLLRYDRLRGTPWADLADRILAPMPDDRSIIGNRHVRLSDLFDALLISSRDPTDVTATTLAARTRLRPAQVRRFLDQPLQRVTWSASRGGALGRRRPSEFKLPGDARVYLQPFPGWVVLTRPGFLGELTRPTPPGADTSLDQARAADADLPPWLSRVRVVEREAGTGAGPIAVVSVAGLHQSDIAVPEVGVLPVPERAALALEMAGGGFYVRGTLAFADPAAAARFEHRLEAARARLTGSTMGRLLLVNFHAENALKGLALRRRGALVTYATSVSGADARAMMELAADWASRFFEAHRGAGAHRRPAGGDARPARPDHASGGSKAQPRTRRPHSTPGPARPGPARPGAPAPSRASPRPHP